MLAAAILGSSMAFIDGSVVNVALPAIQADLSALLRRMQWVVNSYMLILASLILIGGVAGESFTRQIDADPPLRAIFDFIRNARHTSRALAQHSGRYRSLPMTGVKVLSASLL